MLLCHSSEYEPTGNQCGTMQGSEAAKFSSMRLWHLIANGILYYIGAEDVPRRHIETLHH
jgi:hypothetical protein